MLNQCVVAHICKPTARWEVGTIGGKRGQGFEEELGQVSGGSLREKKEGRYVVIKL